MSWRAFTPLRESPSPNHELTHTAGPIEYNTVAYARNSDDSPGASHSSIGTQTAGARGHMYAPVSRSVTLATDLQAKDFSDSVIDATRSKLDLPSLADTPASFGLLGQIQEGFDNVPGYLGAPVRQRGKVDGLRSGVAEGAKGLAYGLADGLSGLFLEPVQGAQKQVRAAFPPHSVRLQDRASRVRSAARSLAVSLPSMTRLTGRSQPRGARHGRRARARDAAG